MKKNNFKLLSIVILSTSHLFASGLSKPVLIGPKAIGLGGAFVGIADDATAIFHNPAALSQLDGLNLFVGGDALITQLDYTPMVNGVAVGPKEKGVREFIPVPNGAVTMRFLNRFTLGAGVFFPHGNGGKFKTVSAIPTNALEGQIFSMEVTPALSLTLVEGLSVGASFRATRISSSIDEQLFAIPGTAFVDTINLLDVDGWGYGYSASLFFNRFKPISFGFNYRSEIKADLKGNACISSTGCGNVTLKQNLPEQYNAGLGLHPCEYLTIGIGYQFEKNSSIKSFDATSSLIPGGSLSLPQNWGDSHTWMIGVEAKPTRDLALRLGYARDFDASVPNSANNRIIGDLAAHDFSTGLAYQWKNLNMSAAWNARFGERTVVGAAPTEVGPGKYEAFIQTVSLGLGYKI